MSSRNEGMVSIQRALAAEDLRVLVDACGNELTRLVTAISDHASHVEGVDPRPEALAAMVKAKEAYAHAIAAARGEDLQRGTSTVQQGLSIFRDDIAKAFAKLRENLVETAHALETVMASVVNDSSNTKADFEKEVGSLEGLAKIQDPQKLRAGLHDAVGRLRTLVKRMEEANNATVLSLRDEIRLLQRHLSDCQQARQAEANVLDGAEFDALAEYEIEARRSFVIIVIAIRNLAVLDHRNGQAIVEDGMQMLLRKVIAALPPGGSVARPDRARIHCLARLPHSDGLKLTRTLGATCSAPVVLGGSKRTLLEFNPQCVCVPFEPAEITNDLKRKLRSLVTLFG